MSRKVIGFGSHISIQKSGEGSVFESNPLQLDPEFIKTLSAIPGIRSVHPVAYIPAMMQSVTQDEQKEILGVVMKGISGDYDMAFIREHLVEGKLPQYNGPQSDEIVISRSIADNLNYKPGDTAKVYFVRQQPVLRNFRITGIYETGFEDSDKKLVFCHLPQVQAMNEWGMQASVIVDDTLAGGNLIVRADVRGGNGNYRYNWGKGYENFSGFTICPVKDTTIRLIVSDYWSNMNEPAGRMDLSVGETAIPDTAYLQIKVKGERNTACTYKLNADNTIPKKYLDNNGFHYSINAGAKTIDVLMIPGKGSYQRYTGLYELTVNDWNEIDQIRDKVAKNVMFRPEMQQQVQVKSIRESQNELFVWLSFLDINMAIVLVLMIVIGIINMGSALLVMILVRTNFIGITKSMGATNGFLRRVFLVQAGRLIFRGMVWGNIIGVGLCVLQHYFGIFPLDPKVYYLSKVPVEISVPAVIALNVATIIVCVLALIIPSVVITRILPAKSIRFR